jgi:uncharacterized protein HemY
LSADSCLTRLGADPAVRALLADGQFGRNDTIVYTACLDPNHGLPVKKLVELAQKNVANKATADTLEALGAAHYCAGEFPQAITKLHEAVKLHGKEGSNWTRLFLAMAYGKQGEPAKAREWLDKATPPTKDAGWEESLIFNRLRAEADLLKIPKRPKGG